VTFGRRLSQAEKDERARPRLEYWNGVTEELRARLAELRAGRDPGPRSDRVNAAVDAVGGVSTEDLAGWAVDNFMALERMVGQAEEDLGAATEDPGSDGLAVDLVPEPEPELVPELEPTPERDVVRAPPPPPPGAGPGPDGPPPGSPEHREFIRWLSS
jgi:hypothetical protein